MVIYLCDCSRHAVATNIGNPNVTLYKESKPLKSSSFVFLVSYGLKVLKIILIVCLIISWIPL